MSAQNKMPTPEKLTCGFSITNLLNFFTGLEALMLTLAPFSGNSNHRLLHLGGV